CLVPYLPCVRTTAFDLISSITCVAHGGHSLFESSLPNASNKCHCNTRACYEHPLDTGTFGTHQAVPDEVTRIPDGLLYGPRWSCYDEIRRHFIYEFAR